MNYETKNVEKFKSDVGGYTGAQGGKYYRITIEWKM